MKQIKSILSAILLSGSLFVVSCEDRTKVTALQTEVEHIHDEAMKQMGPMNAMARQLKKDLGSLDSLSAQYKAIQQTLSAIDHAETDMMDWMKGYKAPDEKVSAEEALKYLNEQKAKIEQNLKDIKVATDEGIKQMTH